MNNELEATWQQAGVLWRTDEHPVSALSNRLVERAERQSQRLRNIVIAEVLLTLVVLSGAFAVISRYGTAGSLRVGAMVLLYTAAVWSFTLWNRRGIWRPYGETTAEFIELLRLRAERRVRSAWFCFMVIGLAAVLVAREIEAALRVGHITPWEWGVWIAFAVYSVGVIMWSIWYMRSARREIQELDGLAQQLGTRSEEQVRNPRSPLHDPSS